MNYLARHPDKVRETRMMTTSRKLKSSTLLYFIFTWTRCSQIVYSINWCQGQANMLNPIYTAIFRFINANIHISI